MALKPTNPKKIPITEGEFRQKLKNKDGDFQNRIFDFTITRDSLQKALGLAEDGNIHFNFDLDFADSEFQKIVGSDRPYSNAPKVIFSGKVSFENAIFSRKANFEGATFSDKVRFKKTTFSGEAKFDGATFSDKVSFIGAIFSDKVSFNMATFSRAVYFNEATFLGEAKFDEARSSDKVSFNRATFSDKVYFEWATFSDKIYFVKATFSREAKFDGATFLDKVSFNRARFSDKVSFIGETFLGEVYFDEARFSDKVSFIGATFSQNHHTYFCNLNLKQNDNPDERNEKETYPTPSLQFRDTIFPKLVLFSNCNLSQTTFERCTIADIKFRSCEFAKTGVWVFKRNAFENRTGQKGFWKNFCLALRLEGRLLKKAFSKKRL